MKIWNILPWVIVQEILHPAGKWKHWIFLYNISIVTSAVKSKKPNSNSLTENVYPATCSRRFESITVAQEFRFSFDENEENVFTALFLCYSTFAGIFIVQPRTFLILSKNFTMIKT